MSRRLLGGLLGLLLAMAPGVAEAAPDEVFPPRPLFWADPLPDPSVVHDGDRWFAAGTGWRGGTASSASEYGGWSIGAPLLDSRPAWATNGDVWAPELERATDGTWLAYYAVPVEGLPHHQHRCIGVATSPHLDTPFTPHSNPLVCPPDAFTPPASDAAPRAEGLPRGGIIDPSSYITPDGRRFLLYRTQGTPSSIRAVRLRPSGLVAGAPSVELVRDHGVLENPVVVDHGGWKYMLLSRGDYGRCGYRTVWRRSRSLQRGWATAPEQVLIDRATSGICGPGGADYLPPGPAGANRVFMHGWVCDLANGPCEKTYSSHDDGHWEEPRRGIRVPYVARLRWTRHGPRVAEFGQGPAWTPPPSGLGVTDRER